MTASLKSSVSVWCHVLHAPPALPPALLPPQTPARWPLIRRLPAAELGPAGAALLGQRRRDVAVGGLGHWPACFLGGGRTKPGLRPAHLLLVEMPFSKLWPRRWRHSAAPV